MNWNNEIICYLCVLFFLRSPEELVYLIKDVLAQIINMPHFIFIIFICGSFFFWVNTFHSSTGSLMGKHGFDCGMIYVTLLANSFSNLVFPFFVFNLNRRAVLIVANKVLDTIKVHQSEHWVVMTIILHSKTFILE